MRKNTYVRKKDCIYIGKDGRVWQHNHLTTRLYWSPQKIADIKRYFPTTINEECAAILGVSVRTLIRKARELGLAKDKEWLKEILRDNQIIATVFSAKSPKPKGFHKGNTYGLEYRFKRKQNVETQTESRAI